MTYSLPRQQVRKLSLSYLLLVLFISYICLIGSSRGATKSDDPLKNDGDQINTFSVFDSTSTSSNRSQTFLIDTGSNVNAEEQRYVRLDFLGLPEQQDIKFRVRVITKRVSQDLSLNIPGDYTITIISLNVFSVFTDPLNMTVTYHYNTNNLQRFIDDEVVSDLNEESIRWAVYDAQTYDSYYVDRWKIQTPSQLDLSRNLVTLSYSSQGIPNPANYHFAVTAGINPQALQTGGTSGLRNSLAIMVTLSFTCLIMIEALSSRFFSRFINV